MTLCPAATVTCNGGPMYDRLVDSGVVPDVPEEYPAPNTVWLVPEGPVGPVVPEGPVDPVLPEGPVGPVLPVLPVRPIDPVFPVFPVFPVSPLSPLAPAGPCGPAGPIVVPPGSWPAAKSFAKSEPSFTFGEVTELGARNLPLTLFFFSVTAA